MAKVNEEFVPSEDEEREATTNGFKISHGKPQPDKRVIKPEEIRAEAPVQKPYRNETVVRSQPAQATPAQRMEADEEGFPEHQTFSLKPVPRKSFWEEGMYEVKIDRAWQAIEPDNFHSDPATGEPMQACFMHVLYVTEGGAALEGRTSMSRHKKSQLTALLSAIFGANPPLDIESDDLVGRHLQIVVKNKVSATTGNEYPTVKDWLRSSRQFEPADK
jgi:hypothetical protein